MPTYKSVLDDEIKSAKFATRKWMLKIILLNHSGIPLTLDGIWILKNVNFNLSYEC